MAESSFRFASEIKQVKKTLSKAIAIGERLKTESMFNSLKQSLAWGEYLRSSVFASGFIQTESKAFPVVKTTVLQFDKKSNCKMQKVKVLIRSSLSESLQLHGL